MDLYRIDFQTLPWQSPMPGLRFKAAARGARQLRLVEYTREMEPHWCEKGHIGFVLDGRLEVRCGSETAVLNAGDGLFLPPGFEHRHMARVLSDVVKVVFVEDLAP
ncbi:MAG TPA: cupin domain-containing protein [Phycisphaerae bacterium]|nr:cupin domain-containing protein [Phycisphaerae bacterium]